MFFCDVIMIFHAGWMFYIDRLNFNSWYFLDGKNSPLNASPMLRIIGKESEEKKIY